MTPFRLLSLLAVLAVTCPVVAAEPTSDVWLQQGNPPVGVENFAGTLVRL